MKRKCVIFDIDGTIADIDHRLHLKKHKEDFYSKAYADEPIVGVIAVLKMFLSNPDYTVIFLTSRPEWTRLTTVSWLHKHINLLNFSPYTLMMRPQGVDKKDYEVKQDIYMSQIKDLYDVELIIEDRQQVVTMWRGLGLTCLQTCEGNY